MDDCSSILMDSGSAPRVTVPCSAAGGREYYTGEASDVARGEMRSESRRRERGDHKGWIVEVGQSKSDEAAESSMQVKPFRRRM